MSQWPPLEVIHDRTPTDDEKTAFVMPAWIAGIQARKDASGDIRVDLDSSPPCWNDGTEARCFKLNETTFSDIFKVAHEGFGNYTFQLLTSCSSPACASTRTGDLSGEMSVSILAAAQPPYVTS
jgi:hypothetical protein